MKRGVRFVLVFIGLAVVVSIAGLAIAGRLADLRPRQIAASLNSFHLSRPHSEIRDAQLIQPTERYV